MVHFDNKTANTTDSTQDFSFSHKCQGTNRYLLVWVMTSANASDVTSVTYNSVAMTRLGSETSQTGCEIWLYGLAAPAGGSNDIRIQTDQVATWSAIAMSFVDVHQSSSTGTVATASSSGSSAVSVDVSSATDEIVADGVYMSDKSKAATVGAGQTEQVNQDESAAGSGDIFGSTEVGAGTTTMSWSLSGSAEWAQIAVPLKPATLESQTITFAYADKAVGNVGDSVHTIPATMSGLNRVLLVAVHWVGTRTVTSVTYNGDALTQIRKETSPLNPKQNIEVFYIVNPDISTGTIQNIVVTMSSAAADTIGWLQFTGGHQTNPIDDTDAVSEASGTLPDNLSATLTLTSNTQQICVDFITLDTDTPTAGAGQTQRYLSTTGAIAAASTEAGASSVTMSQSWATDDDYAFIALGIRQAAGFQSIMAY